MQAKVKLFPINSLAIGLYYCLPTPARLGHVAFINWRHSWWIATGVACWARFNESLAHQFTSSSAEAMFTVHVQLTSSARQYMRHPVFESFCSAGRLAEM